MNRATKSHYLRYLFKKEGECEDAGLRIKISFVSLASLWVNAALRMLGNCPKYLGNELTELEYNSESASVNMFL